MTEHEFDQRMAIFLKGREYSSETAADGSVLVYPKGRKIALYAEINPETFNVEYRQDFSVPVSSADIPVDELDDLRYFVELLTKREI